MLAIVIDMDPRWWLFNDTNRSLVDVIAFYIAAVGESLPHPSKMDVALIAAFPEGAQTIFTGDWTGARGGITRLKERLEAMAKSTPEEVYESPVAQGVSKALCYMNKRKVGVGRIVVFDCSLEPTDFSAQAVPMSNCGWAAAGSTDSEPLAKINVVSLASETPSSVLIGICAKSGGVHIPRGKGYEMGALVQALMFYQVASDTATKSLKKRRQSQRTYMGTTCACHNKSIDKGYVCSVCLAIYCTETAGICSVCGSRIRREAKDDLPIHAQIFSKLFPPNDHVQNIS
jgi:hypothetical protein